MSSPKINFDQDFERLVKEFFENYMQKFPETATVLGLHQYDHLLSDISRTAFLQNIRELKSFKEKIEAIDPSKLSPANKLDRDILLYFLDNMLFQLEVLRGWERNPDPFFPLNVPVYPGDALFIQFIRDYAPFEERLKTMTMRLEKIGKFLEQKKTCIIDPVKLWTETAIESCQGMLSLLESILEFSKPRVSVSVYEDFYAAVRYASGEIKGFIQYLKDDVLPRAKDDWFIGRENFEKLLELRKFEMSYDEIIEVGKKHLDDSTEKMKKMAEKLVPSGDIKEAFSLVKSKHPKTFEEALRKYEEAVEKAEKFLIEREVVTIPEGHELLVTETPSAIRHMIPRAAYYLAGRFEEPQKGVYVVTPPSSEELWGLHSYAGILAITVHEAYPGHHLQLVYANKNPSLVRALAFDFAIELVEGWAHYCEGLMKEHGYADDLETHFVRERDRVSGASSIIIDCKLSTGEMSFDGAVDFIMKYLYLEKGYAIACVKLFTQTPTYFLSYLMGKHLIKRLKEEVKNKMGERFSERFFHDTLLKAGNMPLYYLKRFFEEKIGETLSVK